MWRKMMLGFLVGALVAGSLLFAVPQSDAYSSASCWICAKLDIPDPDGDGEFTRFTCFFWDFGTCACLEATDFSWCRQVGTSCNQNPRV